MSLHSVTHVALRVPRLRDSEDFYRQLFALDVAFREAETDDGWWTLPESADWADAERRGVRLGLVMLHRDGLRLALEAAEKVAPEGQLSHVGLFVDAAELSRLRKLAPSLGCSVVADRDQALVFDDPFSVRWELNTFDYDDPRSLSTGARLGRWLSTAKVEPRRE